MAKRTRRIRHDDETRAKIQASQLINRMMDCASGKIMMDAQQVSCAKALLNKVLPDLQSIALGNGDGSPLAFNMKVEHVKADKP